MNKSIAFIFIILSTFMSSSAAAADNADKLMFEKIFSSWSNAFNHKDLAATCGLFAKNISANYQGAPVKNYDVLCGGFKFVFSKPQEYQYSYKINQVYRSDKLAAVRITWYLRISQHGKVISSGQDEGLDIFEQNSHGDWKIVNYLGYPVNTTP